MVKLILKYAKKVNMYTRVEQKMWLKHFFLDHSFLRVIKNCQNNPAKYILWCQKAHKIVFLLKIPFKKYI